MEILLLALLGTAAGAAVVLFTDRPNFIESLLQRRRQRAAFNAEWDKTVQSVLSNLGRRVTVGGEPYWVTISGQKNGRVYGYVWHRDES